jgi:hypothetical protein
MDNMDEDYRSYEKNQYSYAEDLLEEDLEVFFSNKERKYEQINICAYEVNNEGIYPFLKFLLSKNIFNEKFTFPFLPLYGDISIEKLINFITIHLFSILTLENFQSFKESIKIKGLYEYNNEIYLFIDLTECKLNLNDIYYSSNVMFTLLDEIMNHKSICNIEIDDEVVDFFIYNNKFCYLKSDNNIRYELPAVAYVWSEEKMLSFTHMFGTSKKNNLAILGPYFYFTDYKNASHGIYPNSTILDSTIKWDNLDYNYPDKKNNINKKSGIVRFAIFTGNTKYIENQPNDQIDISEIKKQRLNDNSNSLNQDFERLTMRISDYDGKWIDDYDSCYLGNIELDNGEKIPYTPLFVLKNYNQQIPLSYHYINYSTHIKIGDYSIL